MSSILRSKPQVLYEHVVELRDLCYRVKHIPNDDILSDDNFMLLSSEILKKLIQSLHIDLDVGKLPVLESIHKRLACFEEHILGTKALAEQEKITLEELIVNIESIKVRMQQQDSYCFML